jgi:hypothetical protein
VQAHCALNFGVPMGIRAGVVLSRLCYSSWPMPRCGMCGVVGWPTPDLKNRLRRAWAVSFWMIFRATIGATDVLRALREAVPRHAFAPRALPAGWAAGHGVGSTALPAFLGLCTLTAEMPVLTTIVATGLVVLLCALPLPGVCWIGLDGMQGEDRGSPRWWSSWRLLIVSLPGLALVGLTLCSLIILG